LVLTCDGATVKMFVNGVQQADSKAAGNITYATVGSNVEIGRFYFNPDCFDGIIDEVRIYDAALTADEVKINYFAAMPRGTVICFH